MAQKESENGTEWNVIDDEGNAGSIFSALNLLEAEQQLKDVHDTRDEDAKKLDQYQQMSFQEASGIKGKIGRAAPKFDKNRQLIYLKKLASTGNQSLACAYTPVSRKTIMIHKKANKWFREACDEALSLYSDMVEAELLRRATKGIKRPVFQKGSLVGHERVYSDSLLALAIKAKKVEYRDKLNVDAHVTGGVLVVPQRAESKEEWVSRYGNLQRPSAENRQEDQGEIIEINPQKEEKRITRV